jgi:hypothetical protein
MKRSAIMVARSPKGQRGDTTVKRHGQDASGPWITPWALAERTLGVKPAEARRIQQDLVARGVLRRTKVREAAGKRTVEEFELAGDAARGDADRKAADAGVQPEF